MSTNGSELKKRKMGQLVRDLADDAKTLLRKEVELAKAELQEKVDLLRNDLARDVAAAREQIGESGGLLARGAAFLVAAGLFAIATLGLAAAGLVRILDHGLSLGAALGLTLAIFAAVTALLALLGRRKLTEATPLVLPWTVASIRADAQRVVRENPVEQTVETVKEDVEWLKHPTRSGTR